jgi:hypothetical protein
MDCPILGHRLLLMKEYESAKLQLYRSEVTTTSMGKIIIYLIGAFVNRLVLLGKDWPDLLATMIDSIYYL